MNRTRSKFFPKQGHPGQFPPGRLAVEVWLFRNGWALPLAGLLLLAAGLVTVTHNAEQQAELVKLRAELQATQVTAPPRAAATPAASPNPSEPLRELLGHSDETPRQVSQIAAVARSFGITLPKAQYTSSQQLPSGLAQTDISFNFVAPYPRTRAFIEEVLRKIPSASIERIAFERDQVQGAETETTLRLTLWHWPRPAEKGAQR